MSLQRRYLPALKDHRGRTGAFATVWEGWVNPRDRSYESVGKKNPSSYATIGQVEDRVGVYAVLYHPGGSNLYVAYVGFSRVVQSEIKRKFQDWGIRDDSYFMIAAQYISNSEIAREIESDLYRYYCPPWNTSFH